MEYVFHLCRAQLLTRLLFCSLFVRLTDKANATKNLLSQAMQHQVLGFEATFSETQKKRVANHWAKEARESVQVIGVPEFKVSDDVELDLDGKTMAYDQFIEKNVMHIHDITVRERISEQILQNTLRAYSEDFDEMTAKDLLHIWYNDFNRHLRRRLEKKTLSDDAHEVEEMMDLYIEENGFEDFVVETKDNMS